MMFSLQVCFQDISLSRGCIVTSIMMDKNRQVCLLALFLTGAFLPNPSTHKIYHDSIT